MTTRFTPLPWLTCVALALAGIPLVPAPVASNAPAVLLPDAWASRGIVGEAYDAARHPAYAPLFGRDGWSATAPHTVIVTNESGQDVHGLVVRWAIHDAAGRARWHTVQLDRQSRESGAPVVRARGSAAVTPTGVVPLEFIGQRFITSASVSPALLARLDASAAAPRLDSAILATGEIVGPDQFDIAGYLTSRGLAAETLLAELDRGNVALAPSRTSDPRGALLRQATVPLLYR
jgi:hypothetical protein